MFDVSDVSACAAEVSAAEADLGGINILVNNAGIDTPGDLSEIDEASFDRMFAVHVKGSFFMARAVTPGHEEAKVREDRQRLLHMGHDRPHLPFALLRCQGGAPRVDQGLGEGVCALPHQRDAVAPGGVITEMVLQKGGTEYIEKASQQVPMGRYAEALEVSSTVLFLCGPESDFITGQVISPNGGQVIVGI